LKDEDRPVESELFNEFSDDMLLVDESVAATVPEFLVAGA